MILRAKISAFYLAVAGLIVASLADASNADDFIANRKPSFYENTVLWREFRYGMTIDEVSNELKSMNSIKGFNIEKKSKFVEDILLPSDTNFPIYIKDFIDDEKKTKIIGFPTRFSLGFSPNKKLTTIIIEPILPVKWDVDGVGVCRGYTFENLRVGKAFWETALSQKYQNRTNISDDIVVFSDDKVAVALQFTRIGAIKRFTFEEQKKNPYAYNSLKCHVDTYIPKIIYNNKEILGDILKRNQITKDQNVRGFIDKAKSDL